MGATVVVSAEVGHPTLGAMTYPLPAGPSSAVVADGKPCGDLQKVVDATELPQSPDHTAVPAVAFAVVAGIDHASHLNLYIVAEASGRN